jgi:hypothetical protein
MCGLIALALDLGIMMDDRRAAQGIADSAAMAGGKHLFDSWDDYALPNTAVTQAKVVAKNAALNNDLSKYAASQIIVNSPPTSGSAYGFTGDSYFVGKSGYLEVIVVLEEPRRFSAILGTGNLKIRARSIARGVKSLPEGGLICLEDNLPYGFKSSGNGTIEVQGGIYVNTIPSDQSQGVAASGSVNLQALFYSFSANPATVGWNQDPNQRYSDAGKLRDMNGAKSENVAVGAAPIADPLASLPEPTPADAGALQSLGNKEVKIGHSVSNFINAVQHYKNTGNMNSLLGSTGIDWLTNNPAVVINADGSITLSKNGAQFRLDADGTVHLYPGEFLSGIQISGDARVILEDNVDGSPGIFYMNGGGFLMSGNGGLYGENIMIYNAPGANPKKVQFSGNGQVTLKGPTTGTYAGIALFQARNFDIEMYFSGNFNEGFGTPGTEIVANANAGFFGTIYVPNAMLHISGNSSAIVYPSNWDQISADPNAIPIGGSVIINNLQVSGNGTFAVKRPSGSNAYNYFGLVE